MAAVLAPGVAGSADGLVTRDLPWNGGDHFGVAMSSQTTFTQGPAAKITVTGPREVVDRMVVEGGVVRLRDRGLWRWSDRYPQVRIVASAPHVRSISAAASARIEAGTLDAPSLSLRASSSGSIRGAVRTSSLSTEASSSGSVTASGAADTVDVSSSSSGDVNLRALKVQDAVIRVSSSGDVAANPSRSARVNASSSGHVRLLQRPPQFDSRTSSSGSVSVGG